MLRLQQSRYPVRGARARLRSGQKWFPAKSRERPKKKALTNGQQQQLTCLRPRRAGKDAAGPPSTPKWITIAQRTDVD
jgi:hypothetical protein